MAYKSGPGEIDNLLAIRGLASLGVLLVHCLYASPLAVGNYLQDHWEFGATSRDIIFAIFPRTGGGFVIFFFVLSGYLMGKLFFTERYVLDRSGIFRFYKGRLLRIAPLLYFNLILLLGVTTDSKFQLRRLVGEFLFLNNFTGSAINGVTWSISHEMQYYLIAPLVFWLFGGTKIRSLLLTCGAIACFVLIRVAARDYQLFGHHKLPIDNICFFLTGFAVNIVIRRYPVRKPALGDLLAVLIGFFGGHLVFNFITNAGQERLGEIALALLAAGCVYVIELPGREGPGSPTTNGLTWGLGHAWTWLGLISYGLYLWHAPIVLAKNNEFEALTNRLMPSNPGDVTWQKSLLFSVIQIPSVLVLTTVISVGTFFLIERAFRPNLYRRKAPASAASV